MQKGGALEELIENIGTQLRILGQGVLLKQNVLWITYGNMTFPKKGAPVDFLGVIKGIPVAIECKETISDRIRFSESHFSSKEKAFLSDFERAGGKAFVVFAFWKFNGLYIVKHADFEGYNRQSITDKACKMLGKKLNMNVNDFVEFVKSA
ncbi:Holliday junction resolvase RecU [Thermoanaerobacterium thermosaccharolyticum]|uniref:Holliday junction resolvase RecU n=1 Tax=Thermoanaerobacterium thermosaccharolyticum TaxID=1517 RepID=UPI0017811BA9|nr:Holliday junction resolvase RecU [Thermoanaerobacterium thermosaccharolyticum]